MDMFVELDVSQTLTQAGRLYWNSSNARTFIQLALFFVLPATVVLLAVIHSTIDRGIDDNSGGIFKFFFRNLDSFLAVLGSQSLLKATLGAVSEAAICVAVSELYLNRVPKWHLCLQRGISRVVVLLLANIMAGIGTFIGYLFLFIPGVFLYISLSLVTPVIVLEHSGSAVEVLMRSWSLTSSHRVYVLKCLATLGVLYWVLTAIMNKIAGAHFLSLSFHLLRMIPASVFYPALCILKTVMYINIRVISEGLTAEQFCREVGEAGSEVGTEYSRVPLVLDQDVAPGGPTAAGGEDVSPEWTNT